MRKEKFDKVWVGVLAGVLGAVAGFILFGFGFAFVNATTFSDFFHEVFLGIQDFQSRIVTVSMLIDVVLFFIFIRKDYQQFCKGLIAVLVLAVLAVVALY